MDTEEEWLRKAKQTLAEYDTQLKETAKPEPQKQPPWLAVVFMMVGVLVMLWGERLVAKWIGA